jgi:hypothetical protein
VSSTSSKPGVNPNEQRYTAVAIEGTLTIKDRPLPVTGLKATVDKGVLHITGKFDIARKDADLGQESDAGGDYVSLKIGADVNVTAKAPL